MKVTNDVIITQEKEEEILILRKGA
jgi:hypothetical protein